MAAALERILGKQIKGGLIIVKHGHRVPVSRVRITEAAHPVPDASGLAGARRILSILEGAGASDLVIVLLSGGGSALMPLPVRGVTLAQKQAATQLLLRCGATINEINVIRKHLSGIKGGRLAQLAAPAPVLTLVLSDVPGNPMDTIASGPTYPDPSTYGDAVRILRKYGIWKKVPRPVRAHIEAGRRGICRETLKQRDPVFRKVRHVIIGDNQVALRAAARGARAAGYEPRILTSFLKGEAREVAQVFGAIAREHHFKRRGRRGRVCWLASGETTVTVKGDGVGGRCQEFALAGALEIAGMPGTVLAAFGTDGTDGPTDAAGAYADGEMLSAAAGRGLKLGDFLARNDSFPVMKRMGRLIKTGPTLTNVNDIYLLLAP